MRMKYLAIVVVGMLGVPALANAAPTAPSATQTGIATHPEFLQVRGGCGPGFYPTQWRDRWGRWHRRCVPFPRSRGRGWWGGPGPRWRPGWR